MITLSEYARRSGISYQAVGQTVKRYRNDLEGHIVKQGKTRFLDDEAVAFLDEHRKYAKTIVEANQRTDTEVELIVQNKQLLDKLNMAYEALLAEKTKYSELQDRHTALIEEHTALQLSIAQKEQEAEQEAETAAEQDSPSEATESPVADETEQAEEVITKKENRLIRAWKVLWNG